MKKILMVHQGHELYGSDRMFLLSIKTILKLYPRAVIDVILPKSGDLSRYILLNHSKNVQLSLVDLAIVRKSEIQKLDFSVLYYLIKNIAHWRKKIHSYDLVYINSIVVIDFILLTRYFKGKKIIHVHELLGPSWRFLFSKVLQFSQCSLVFISKASLKSIGPSNKSLSVIHNGKDHILDHEPNLVSAGEIRILMVGRLNSWKGQDLLLDAISIVQDQYRGRMTIKILGGTYNNQYWFEKALRKKIQDLQLDQIVKLIDFEKETDIHYQWSNIVVVPSKLPEPFGLVAIEAMRFSKVVIAAGHGGLTEIVDDNVTGILFQPNSKRALAEKIEYLIENPSVIREIGLNANAKFNSFYTQDHYIERLERFISKI
ncbi:MAG: glycosyltransferase involved in cell wall biosynthesis [Parvicella sp.]